MGPPSQIQIPLPIQPGAELIDGRLWLSLELFNGVSSMRCPLMIDQAKLYHKRIGELIEQAEREGARSPILIASANGLNSIR